MSSMWQFTWETLAESFFSRDTGGTLLEATLSAPRTELLLASWPGLAGRPTATAAGRSVSRMVQILYVMTCPAPTSGQEALLSLTASPGCGGTVGRL